MYNPLSLLLAAQGQLSHVRREATCEAAQQTVICQHEVGTTVSGYREISNRTR